jgi:hypothetical protein
MRICLAFRQDVRLDGPVECYARSALESLEKEHEVVAVGEGHKIASINELVQTDYDCLIEIENGRNSKGDLAFQQFDHPWSIPSAVWLIDSHGHPDWHKKVARKYDHVFFAVWARRELFTKHSSAHWCPNATDFKWFNEFDDNLLGDVEPETDFGFFGSKGGLNRADPLKEICIKNGWSYDIRQVTKPHKHKWPQCARAMATCHNLFNHGQKHDGPNQRVMESMAMHRPLLTDSTDETDGMDALFEEGRHYIGYGSYDYEDLEEKCKWVMQHPELAYRIAASAYWEVKEHHQVSNRMAQIMEVLESG